MATFTDPAPLTADEIDRLRDRALREAAVLRQAAIAALWRDIDGFVDESVVAGQRAARRLAARLREHAKRRAASQCSAES